MTYTPIEQNIKQRMLDNVPTFYFENEILDELYSTIEEELKTIAGFLLTPDVRENNPDPNVQFEIDKYLNNEMGWGFERLVQQFFIIGVNMLLERTVELYDVEQTDDYISLRNRLLLYSSLHRSINQFELQREFDFIGENLIQSISFNKETSKIIVNLGTVTSDQINAIINRQLDSLLPAHLDFNFESSRSIEFQFNIGTSIFNHKNVYVGPPIVERPYKHDFTLVFVIGSGNIIASEDIDGSSISNNVFITPNRKSRTLNEVIRVDFSNRSIRLSSDESMENDQWPDRIEISRTGAVSRLSSPGNYVLREAGAQVDYQWDRTSSPLWRTAGSGQSGLTMYWD